MNPDTGLPRNAGPGETSSEMTIEYKPRDPLVYRPPIGLIGCGGITKHHLKAYRDAGYDIVALCDLNRQAAEARRDEFFPKAAVFEDFQKVLDRDDIEVVDVTTHPEQRTSIVEAALSAQKHVLSQKPFVLDLDIGQRLVDLAEKKQVKLAVNQNGRWAPHFSFMRAAVSSGYLGEIAGVRMSMHWDHTWVKGTPFENIKHLILYDYAIHWFDMVACLMEGRVARSVYATATRTRRQTIVPPLLGQAMLEFEGAQASLAFDGDTQFGAQDRTYIAGTEGSISSVGPDNNEQQLTLSTKAGDFQPHLQGRWFPDGFHGTMGELLCSIEEKRRPTIDAARNLTSLALCFAAVASAESGEPVVPGTVRRL